MEDSLVSDLEQGVQNRAARLEDFFRRGKASHQVREIPPPGSILRTNPSVKFGDQRRLCNARQPGYDKALPCEQGDQRGANQFIVFDQRRR
jgi:hypothetical protein